MFEDDTVIDEMTVLSASLITDFHKRKKVVLPFLDYPYEEREDVTEVRKWLFRHILPMASYMHEVARLFSHPYGELMVDEIAIALIDEMFRDGTMRMVYNKVNSLNEIDHTKPSLPVEFGGVGENPYGNIVLPPPISFELKVVRWWEAAQLANLVADLDNIIGGSYE